MRSDGVSPVACCGTKAAARMITRALTDEAADRLHRAALLPAQVDVAVASEDLATARSAAQ
jgi:hypothetical protein